MLSFGMGIRHVQSTLPGLVYALLSGLNSGTVGLIALAAVQLGERAIVGRMTRLIVCASACIGMLYKGTFNVDIESELSLVVLSLYTHHIRDLDGNLGYTQVTGCLRATP
jgi:hypothetical protein